MRFPTEFESKSSLSINDSFLIADSEDDSKAKKTTLQSIKDAVASASGGAHIEVSHYIANIDATNRVVSVQAADINFTQRSDIGIVKIYKATLNGVAVDDITPYKDYKVKMYVRDEGLGDYYWLAKKMSQGNSNKKKYEAATLGDLYGISFIIYDYADVDYKFVLAIPQASESTTIPVDRQVELTDDDHTYTIQDNTDNSIGVLNYTTTDIDYTTTSETIGGGTIIVPQSLTSDKTITLVVGAKGVQLRKQSTIYKYSGNSTIFVSYSADNSEWTIVAVNETIKVEDLTNIEANNVLYADDLIQATDTEIKTNIQLGEYIVIAENTDRLTEGGLFVKQTDTRVANIWRTRITKIAELNQLRLITCVADDSTQGLYVCINEEVSKVEGGGASIEVVQETGTSTTAVMSQNAVTTELATKANTTDLNAKQNTLTQGEGIKLQNDTISLNSFRGTQSQYDDLTDAVKNSLYIALIIEE